MAVFGRSNEGIDFQSPDDSPAKYICLLLVPEEQASQHLQTLANLAKAFGQPQRREALLTAVTAEELADILTAA